MKACPICKQLNLPGMAGIFDVCPSCYEAGDKKYSDHLKDRQEAMSKHMLETRGDHITELKKEITDLKEEVAELTFELETYRKEIERLYNSRRIKC